MDDKPIGGGHTPYIFAELSANHNESLQRELDKISVSKACVADVIKSQIYTAETMTIDCD